MTTLPPGPWAPNGVTAFRGVDDEVGTKAASLEGLNRSVASATPGVATPGGASLLLFGLAANGESMTAWGVAPATRDREMRAFFPTEPFLASSIGIVCARNAAMDWKISGDPATADAAALMLQNANFGAGWEDFISRITVDLLTQDKGAFVELMRDVDSPDAPVLGIGNLDAARCHLTGMPEEPVWYEDSQNKMHRLKWYQVVQLLEMPSNYTFPRLGHFYRLQYCAVSRLLRAAQIIKALGIYNEEKITGRFQRVVHLVQGATTEEFHAALNRAEFYADQMGLTRYIQPAVVGSIDPKTSIDVKSVELATVPEGWDEEKSSKWYLTAIAMALLTDYGELAPLPGGNLGTSAQSEVMHLKSRGKGQGLFMQMVARLMNLHGVLPRNVEFAWDEQDIEAEHTAAEVQGLRATGRASRIASGEINKRVAREIALAEGDLTEEQVKALEEDDKRIEAEQAAAAQALADETIEGEERPSGPGGGPGAGRQGTVPGEQRAGQRGLLTVTPEWGEKARGSVAFGTLITSRLHRMYATTADDASGLGYFPDLEDRLAVASSIGPALQVFEEALRDAGVWDIQVRAEDADRIVETSLKAIDPEGDGINAEEAREAFEGEMADVIYAGLQGVRRDLRARLQGSPASAVVAERALTPEPEPAPPEPPREQVQDIEYGPNGRMRAIRTREIADPAARLRAERAASPPRELPPLDVTPLTKVQDIEYGPNGRMRTIRTRFVEEAAK